MDSEIKRKVNILDNIIVLTIANRKGGTSKTTTTNILAPYFAYVLGLRVLIFDLDEQGNLTKRYLGMDVDEKGDVLPRIHPFADKIRERVGAQFSGRSSSTAWFYPNETFIPYPCANMPTMKVAPAFGEQIRELKKGKVSGKEHADIESVLFENLNRKKFLEKKPYDVVLFDTPPDMNPLTLAALRASTHVLIPTQLEKMSQEGLLGVVSKINIENRNKPQSKKSKLLGILPCNVNYWQQGRLELINQKYLEEIYNDKVLGPALMRNPFYHNGEVPKLNEVDDPKFKVAATYPFHPKSDKTLKRMCTAFCDEVAVRLGLINDSYLKKSAFRKLEVFNQPPAYAAEVEA